MVRVQHDQQCHIRYLDALLMDGSLSRRVTGVKGGNLNNNEREKESSFQGLVLVLSHLSAAAEKNNSKISKNTLNISTPESLVRFKHGHISCFLYKHSLNSLKVKKH